MVIPPPAVSEAGQQVVEIRAGSARPVVLLTEGPPIQVVAVQEQEDKAYEQNTVARPFPIVVAA